MKHRKTAELAISLVRLARLGRQSCGLTRRILALSGLEKERLLPPLYLAREGTAAGLQGSVKGDRYDCFGPSGFKPRRMTAFPISLSLLAPLEIKREPQQERETEYECVS